MKKEETQGLNELSRQCFGSPYAWRKLRTKGLVIGHDKESGHIRRTPLTTEQAKNYMIKTLEMRANLEKEIEDEKTKSGE